MLAAPGVAPPAEDVPLPEMLGSQESEALATTLYASDFISQFSDVLHVQQPLSFLQLHVSRLAYTRRLVSILCYS